MSDKPKSGGKNLVPAVIGAVGTAVAAFFGAAGSAVSAPVTLVAAIANLWDRITQQREQERRKRFEMIAQLLDRRFDGLEVGEGSEEQQNLFLSVLESALKDDEAAKLPMYVAVLEWIMRKWPPAAQVRILADAVRSLSYLELYCFLTENAGHPARKLHEPIVTDNQLWNRLRGAGLSEGTARVKAGATDAGKTLAKYCSVDELPEPEHRVSSWES